MVHELSLDKFGRGMISPLDRWEMGSNGLLHSDTFGSISFFRHTLDVNIYLLVIVVGAEFYYSIG